MSEFKVGDWIIDSFIGDKVIQYHDGYRFMSKKLQEAVLRHATKKEEKAGRRLS